MCSLCNASMTTSTGSNTNVWVSPWQLTSNTPNVLTPYRVIFQSTTSTVTTATINSTATNVWYHWVQHENVKREARKITEAQRLQRQREQEELQRQLAEETKRRREAKARAKKLLVQHLTPEQQRSLDERGYFDIGVAGKTYRIRQGTHGNVRLVENGRETVSFCAQPDGVPDEDAMLAQKFALETDEAMFLRIANARRLAA